MRFKLKSGTKFTLIVVGVLAAGYGAWVGYAALRLANYSFKPIEPGTVNLIAIRPDAGYRIIVANQVAALVETGGGGMDDRFEEEQDVQNARRLPIRALLGSMQGDEKDLSELVMSLNKLSEAELPPVRVTWKAEDLQKALDGDQALQAKLENDLHLRLDGTPLPSLRWSSIENGIVIDSPVSVEVKVGDEVRTLTARVVEEYQPAFNRIISERLSKRFNPPVEEVMGIFRDEYNKVISGESDKENIRDVLTRRVAKSRLDGFAQKPSAVLRSATVVLNETYVKGASYSKTETRQGDVFDIQLAVTDDGRMRMWKYSHDHPRFQLLLTADGVAIAAPRITTELRESTLTITGMRNQRLVEGAVDTLNRLSQEANRK